MTMGVNYHEATTMRIIIITAMLACVTPALAHHADNDAAYWQWRARQFAKDMDECSQSDTTLCIGLTNTNDRLRDVEDRLGVPQEEQ
jgi:hypothetical protein